MAFAFLVEDGSGLSSATSYVSVADADDYFAIDANNEAWDALPEEQKEFFLAWATRYIDQKVNWKGSKATSVQGLRWPRVYVKDRDGVYIEDDVIPTQVKQITYEVARWLMDNDPAAGSDVENLKKVVVDVVEIEYQDQTSQTSFPTLFSDILQGIGTFRIGGRGHANIIKA